MCFPICPDMSNLIPRSFRPLPHYVFAQILPFWYPYNSNHMYPNTAHVYPVLAQIQVLCYTYHVAHICPICTYPYTSQLLRRSFSPYLSHMWLPRYFPVDTHITHLWVNTYGHHMVKMWSGSAQVAQVFLTWAPCIYVAWHTILVIIKQLLWKFLKWLQNKLNGSESIALLLLNLCWFTTQTTHSNTLL